MISEMLWWREAAVDVIGNRIFFLTLIHLNKKSTGWESRVVYEFFWSKLAFVDGHQQRVL